MKKQFLSFLSVLSAMLLISASAFAGGNQTPAPGETVTYDVTSGLTSYEWHIYDHGTTTEATTAYTGTLGSSSSISVQWTAASAGNQYDVWVQATDTHGCKTDPQTRLVTVSNTQFCIATGAGPAGAVTTAAPTNLNQCSLLTDNSTGYNGSGTYGDNTTFYATITGGIPSLTAGSAYTVTYTVSDGTNTDTETTAANLITDSNGDGALSITVNAVDHVSVYTAPNGGGAKTVTITVTKISYNGVDVTNACVGNNYTLTVQELPAISF